jgi:long-chain acyl-CoA synthetase
MDRSQRIAQVTAELTAPGQPFEITEAVVHGRRLRVWLNAPVTLADLLVTGNAWGELPFLVHGDERWTYAEHGRAAASFARWLVADAGVRPGDRIALAASNRIAWSIAFWGAAASGAVIVPLNSWGTGEELEYAIRDSGATVLLADAARLERLVNRLPEGMTVVALDEPSAGYASAVRLSAIADPKAPFALPLVAVDTDDDATIFYTSGTTGRPKGAVGTHRNITTNVMNLLFWGARAVGMASEGTPSPLASTEQAGSLVTVPLFHATGCHATLVTAMAQGVKLVLLNRFDPQVAVDLIEQERLTRLVGVPTTVMAVLNAGVDRDLSSITYVAYGGSPAPSSLPQRIRTQLPQASCGVGYGLTESSANATTNIGEEYEEHPDSVGTPCPVIDITAVDADGVALPPGEVGELVISGPNIVRGYWNRPEDTAAAFVDGSLRTGDIGYLDQAGRVFISDRSKDVVIRGGENVYCAEIENILGEHPDISEAAVIGRPHSLLGEEVVAVVTPRGGVGRDDLDVAEVQAFVRLRLASFKVPAHIIVCVDPLPRTPTGKLRKDVLRADLADLEAIS